MSSCENLSPQVLGSIAREMRKMMQKPPEGIKIIVNEENITDIQAELMGPVGTPFEGGVFRLKLVLSSDFPASPPKGFFLTKIFHPNIANNGDICVNTLKKDWKSTHGITHILRVIRCLLIVPFPESALNAEASKMFLESYEDYAKRARMLTGIHAQPKKGSCGGAGASGSGCNDAAGEGGGLTLFAQVRSTRARGSQPAELGRQARERVFSLGEAWQPEQAAQTEEENCRRAPSRCPQWWRVDGRRPLASTLQLRYKREMAKMPTLYWPYNDHIASIDRKQS